MNFKSPVIAPSILAADYGKLGEQVQACVQSETKWLHCDIMDGHFVPNISFGPDVVKAVHKSVPDAFLDVHLMIENPDIFIGPFAEAGAGLITVHQETCPHLHRTLQNIRGQDCMTGVAINPATPVPAIEHIAADADLILIMTVNPGFGGQKFIESSYKKLTELVALRNERNLNFLIQVDGGVTLKNTEKLVHYGTDVLVAGSSVFKTPSVSEAIENLYQAASVAAGKLV